jgi:3-oxoacyl-[acyl-carrier protein] reductase
VDLGLRGKRTLVGGGGSGLGGGVARVLAQEGARVVIVGRTAARLEAMAAEIGSGWLAADLSTAEGPAATIAGAVDQLGGLDLLVANTGGPPGGTFEDIDEQGWLGAIEGTLQPVLRLIRASLPYLRTGSDPAILVNLSSSVREPIPALITSNVLRPGLAGLIKALTAEIAPIRINGLAPGRFDTDRVRQLDAARAAAEGLTIEQVRERMEARLPLGRYGDPLELGRVAAFLLSPAASYVTGAIVPVDAGMVRALP